MPPFAFSLQALDHALDNALSDAYNASPWLNDTVQKSPTLIWVHYEDLEHNAVDEDLPATDHWDQFWAAISLLVHLYALLLTCSMMLCLYSASHRMARTANSAEPWRTAYRRYRQA